MPGRFISVPGTNRWEASFQGTLVDEDKHSLWRPDWTFYQRGLKSQPYPRDWRILWPSRSGMFTDPANVVENTFHLNNNVSQIGDGWEPWSCGFGGQVGQKFIMGQCLDSLGASVSGAVVQGFVTSTDVLVTETTADSTGMYELGTPYPATNHYLVAYRAGAPDIAGTTVNTLQGTNRDGT